MRIRNIICFCLGWFCFSSCTTTGIYLNVLRPADITIPQHIQKVVLANRSLPSKENRVENVVEGMFTGEGILMDKSGSKYCIMGLANMLNANQRFVVSNADAIELRGTGTSEFDLPLDWSLVQEICDGYKADALIVLETFDSNSGIFVGSPKRRKSKVKGVTIVELEYPATLTMKIESGWRIYDVSNKVLVDENKFIEIKDFQAFGSNPDEAKMNLPSKTGAVQTSGRFAGEEYGYRISPIWIKVKRIYYCGKHEDLKQAKFLVNHHDWDAAINLWKPLSENADNKVAAMACYNMALASEVKGELDTAIEWAKKSVSLGDKKAQSYIAILYKRKKDNQQLKEQIK